MPSLLKEIKEISATTRDLIKFSHTVSIGLVLISILLIINNQPFGPHLIVAAILISLLGLTNPKTIIFLYKPWMTIALIVGHIMTTIILTAAFYLVITPLGIVLRALGKITLEKHMQKSASTYWRQRTNDSQSKESLKHQF